jgi:hypothetical protein
VTTTLMMEAEQVAKMFISDSISIKLIAKQILAHLFSVKCTFILPLKIKV